MITNQDIENWFSYHSPKDNQPERYQAIRTGAKELAYIIIKNTPTSAYQTASIKLFRECVFAANAAIACGE